MTGGSSNNSRIHVTITMLTDAAFVHFRARISFGDPPPLATTAVNLDDTTGAYRFRLGFVPTGTHTVAFTCGADDDGAESDDAIVFSAPRNVDILAGQTTTVEFAATP